MAGPRISYVPGEDRHRPIHVLHNDLVLRLTVMEAHALQQRLAARLAAITVVINKRPQMSDHQRRHLHALLREHDATGDARFPILARILDRDIASTNDLDPDDADRCISVLTRTRPGPDPDGTEPF